MASTAQTDIRPALTRLAEHDASRVLARLARALGPGRFDLAEDAVQHALLQALRLWPRTGLPAAPSAWLFTVARNHVRDRLRRDRRWTSADDALLKLPAPQPVGSDEPRFSRELSDDELAMLFAACHPALSMESRIAFALNSLCGLSARQIAAGLLTSEAAIAKRLSRAKRALADLDVSFEPPSVADLQGRLEDVRTVLYLLFNEGYSTSGGDGLSAPDLCREATRLAAALARHPVTTAPETDALAALLMLSLARVLGRLGPDGVALLLEEQDRSQWDRALIAEGLHHLARSARGTKVSVWHLRAEIAAIHAIAPSAAETDWERLVDAYDRLCAIDDSAMVRLGRAVAISKVSGPLAGLRAVRAPLAELPGNPYVQAAAGQFLLELGKTRQAALRFSRAAGRARNEPERRLMERRALGCR